MCELVLGGITESVDVIQFIINSRFLVAAISCTAASALCGLYERNRACDCHVLNPKRVRKMQNSENAHSTKPKEKPPQQPMSLHIARVERFVAGSGCVVWEVWSASCSKLESVPVRPRFAVL